MILSIDSNDALCSVDAQKNTISRLSGFLESMMKKLEDVGVLVARILMPILFITAGWGKSPDMRVSNSTWKPWASQDLCCRW